MKIIAPSYRITNINTTNHRLTENRMDYNSLARLNTSLFVSFGSTNAETLARMRNIISSKSYNFMDLKKVFDGMNNAAKNNIHGQVNVFRKFGMTLEKWLPIAVKGDLYGNKPSTISENFQDVIHMFSQYGLEPKAYFEACTKHSRLFDQSPETIEKNIRNLVVRFKDEGLTTEKYIKACLKQPQLFGQTPETIEKNVRNLVAKFEKEGLSTEQYLTACLKQPSLFCISPEKIEKNVRNLVSKFKNEGLNVEQYIRACVKCPSLFYASPKTIEKHIRNMVKKFEKEGLTVSKYLTAGINYPPLFRRSPETVEKNVRDLVSKFKQDGLTTKQYLHTCLKWSPLFCQSPATVEEHIKAFEFSYKNNNNNRSITDIVSKCYLTLSTSSIYLRNIIRSQIKEQSAALANLETSGIKPRLKNYFEKHPDKKFKIEVIDDEMTENFIKTMKEYSLKEYGRDNMFRYTIRPGSINS